MKKILILLAAAMMILSACSNKLTVEQAEAAVMQGEEKDRLPLLLQTLPFLDDITIDSIRLNITDEPMQGYLYTTWKSGKKVKLIIVPIDSIQTDATRKDYIQWQSHWDDVARA